MTNTTTHAVTDAEFIAKVKTDWNASQPSWNCWDNLTERDHLLLVLAASRAPVAVVAQLHDAISKVCVEEHRATPGMVALHVISAARTAPPSTPPSEQQPEENPVHLDNDASGGVPK